VETSLPGLDQCVILFCSVLLRGEKNIMSILNKWALHLGKKKKLGRFHLGLIFSKIEKIKIKPYDFFLAKKNLAKIAN